MVENNFDSIIGCTLKNIVIIEDRELDLDEVALDSVGFYFDNYNVIELNPVVDTDEINIKFISIQDRNKNDSITLSSVIGEAQKQHYSWSAELIDKKIQAIWLCTNHQGYQDQIIFAFDYFSPSISFVAEDSVLKVFQYRPIYKRLNDRNTNKETLVENN